MGLKTIGYGAFFGTGLRQLEVPVTVGTIGGRAFARCDELESLILPPKLEVITCELFESCRQLYEIEIPRTAKVIEQSAFENCEALEALDLLHCTQCLTIEKSAFKSCSRLSWITLPPNLEGMIEEGTFEGCFQLTHIRASKNVANIGGLEDCESLLSLEVPQEVEGIQLNIVDYDGGNIDDGWGSFQEATLECSSLVNLYLPPSASVQGLDRVLNVPIPESFHLAKVARDWRDLVAKLQKRFDGLPLHKVCYFQSYHPIEDTIHQVRSILVDNQSTVLQVNAFGMTPVHILALAHSPRVKLLQELLNSVDVALTAEDRFGSTPLGYLVQNFSAGGLQATRWLMEKVVEQRGGFLGLERWKQELLVLLEEGVVRQAKGLSTMSCELQSLLHRLAKLEFLE
ncbi:MAG: hypothetical protein SGBAC_011610, partial [Bacillariaceae sp.]